VIIITIERRGVNVPQEEEKPIQIVRVEETGFNWWSGRSVNEIEFSDGFTFKMTGTNLKDEDIFEERKQIEDRAEIPIVNWVNFPH